MYIKSEDAINLLCPVMSCKENVYCSSTKCMAWKRKTIIMDKGKSNFSYPDNVKIVKKLGYIKNILSWKEFDSTYGYCTLYKGQK